MGYSPWGHKELDMTETNTPCYTIGCLYYYFSECILFLCADIRNKVKIQLHIAGDSDSKESACNAGDLGLIPGSGRSPGEGNGSPLEYSCLENHMDRGAWQATPLGVAKSRA